MAYWTGEVAEVTVTYVEGAYPRVKWNGSAKVAVITRTALERLLELAELKLERT